jgi:hypothetical protein
MLPDDVRGAQRSSTFVKASSVAVGTFNIYIIQPGWLTRVGILPPGTEITIEANMTRPGFRLSSPALKTLWFVSPGKLAIETTDSNVDCGRQMSDVLKMIPVTPVFGVGNNVTLTAKRSEIEPLPVLEACTAAALLPDGYSEDRRVSAMSVTREGRTFNLNVVVRGDVVEFHGNADSTLGDDGTGERGAECASRFEADKQELISLFSDVFGVKLDVASHA